MLDRTIIPSIKEVDQVYFPSPEVFTLDNGIKCHAFNIGTQDVVQIDVTFEINRRNGSNPQVAKAVNELVGETTLQKPYGVLGEQIDYYGAFLESNYGVDHSSISLFSLTNKLGEVLPLFEEALKESIFPERELKIYLQNKKQKFMIQQEKVSTQVRRLYSGLLYGDHYYGDKTEVEDFDETTSESLTSFYQDYYVAENCSIMITGKFSSDLLKEINERFGNFRSGKKNDSNQPLDLSNPSRELYLKEDALQSAIRIGKILDVTFGSEEYFNLKVLNTLLGGYFGSRLMMNIREDKGYTYGIGSSISAMINGTVFSIATEVGVDVTKAAITEIYKELDRLSNERVGDDELETVKNHMMGSILSASDGPFSIAQQFKSVHFKGEDLSFFERFIEVIKGVTSEDLQNTAKKYLDKTSMVEAIAGKVL